MTRFCAGYITMVGATFVTHPLDTLRVRVSVQPDSAFTNRETGIHGGRRARAVRRVWRDTHRCRAARRDWLWGV